MTVRIDVYDDNNLVEEAADAGCKAVLETSAHGRRQYKIVGPDDLLVPLLLAWGYEENEGYELVTLVEQGQCQHGHVAPCYTCGEHSAKSRQQDIEAAHYIGEPR